MSTPEFLIGLSTASSKEEARMIAETLVEEQLAACVSIVPNIESIYKWKGSVERAEESLLVIKTTQEQTAHIIERIGQLHSYKVPEVIFLPIVSGAENYLAWLKSIGD
ncbi:MAG: divalent-cation tolerance protein CutA [Acidobacteriota bacterium]